MPIVFLGLGSNLGDRSKYIHDALDLLGAAGIRALRLSHIVETDPVGGPPQGLFLNAVLKAETDLSPEEVLRISQGIENRLGRVREAVHGPRTIDIDILLYDSRRINIPGLIIPHPKMWERDFVMIPLQEIDPTITTFSSQDF